MSDHSANRSSRSPRRSDHANRDRGKRGGSFRKERSSGNTEGQRSRSTARAAFSRVIADDAWASPIVDRVLRDADLDDRDAAFAANLVFSTVRWLGTVDWILTHHVTRPLEEVEPELLDILRLGTWELLYGASPDHAAVNTWAEVARRTVGNRAVGFINGVLRSVARGTDDLPWPDRDSDHGLALHHGYPQWIVELARDRVGNDRLNNFLEAGNVPAALALRAIVDRDKVLASLRDDGVDARPGELTPDTVVLNDRVPPNRLTCLKDGSAIVQDQSSQVVGRVAADGVPLGALTIDLCAAPGGKTTHLAQQGLTVLAVDQNPKRLDSVAALASRLGMAVSTIYADGRDPGLGEGEAAAVLVDAPCSGLGVVRRRPELRWRKAPDDVSSLSTIQRQLLASAIDLTQPGGRITYSVCTWTNAETDEVIGDALERGLVEVVRDLPDVGTETTYGRQLAPDTDAGDGMYFAVLRRT